MLRPLLLNWIARQLVYLGLWSEIDCLDPTFRFRSWYGAADALSRQPATKNNRSEAGKEDIEAFLGYRLQNIMSPREKIKGIRLTLVKVNWTKESWNIYKMNIKYQLYGTQKEWTYRLRRNVIESSIQKGKPNLAQHSSLPQSTQKGGEVLTHLFCGTSESGIWWLHTVGRDFGLKSCRIHFTKYIISHSPTQISKIGPRDDLRIPFLNRLILKLYIR